MMLRLAYVIRLLLASVFPRLGRSLKVEARSSGSKSAAWMHAHNHHLSGTPAKLIRTVTGLVHVTEYLDPLRGKS